MIEAFNVLRLPEAAVCSYRSLDKLFTLADIFPLLANKQRKSGKTKPETNAPPKRAGLSFRCLKEANPFGSLKA